MLPHEAFVVNSALNSSQPIIIINLNEINKNLGVNCHLATKYESFLSMVTLLW